jgi:hypothetical protein
MTTERRTEFATEMAFMQWKWGEVLTNDPYLSPSFSRSSEHPLVDPDHGIPPWREYRFSVRNVGGFTEGVFDRFTIPAHSKFSFHATFPFRRPTPISRISLSLAPYSTRPTSLHGWLRPFNSGAVELRVADLTNEDPSRIELELTEAVSLDRMTPIEISLDLTESIERMDLVSRFSGDWGDGGALLGPHLIEVFALPRFDAS